MAFTHALSTNNYGPAKFIVATSAANGTHTTLASAMADAVSGDIIFMRDSVTENVTLTPGVSITSFAGSPSSSQVSITGTLTMTGAGICNLSHICLVTNSSYLLAVTGSAASIVNLNNCYLNCTNNTGVSFTTSSSSAQININNCLGNLGTTGIGLFSDSSAGNMTIKNSYITNSGASTTASTCSAGSFSIYNSLMNFPITYSSSNTISSISYSICDVGALNITFLTSSGTGSIAFNNCYIASGTASGLSVGTGTTIQINYCLIFNSNTDALTGAGTLVSRGTIFPGSSNFSNVTTQTGGAISGLTQGTAPSSGFLGEQIKNYGSSVSLSNSSATNITSINLTAGIWDISALLSISFSVAGSACVGAISVNSNSFTGSSEGDSRMTLTPTSANGICVSIPAYRVTLSATTTYYLVAQANFGSGTAAGSGRLSATRVG